MRKMICPAAAALLMASLPAAAQNLNPTVSVTRAYEGKLLESEKPSLRMSVPDSVTNFNLDFDYSVLANSYRGGTSSTPFLQDIRPERKLAKTSRLWLRAGAGYNLHPELNFVWEAVRRDRFSLNLYADHNSYYGRYRGIGLGTETDRSGNERKVLATNSYLSDSSEPRFVGYDLDTRAGIGGRYDWESGSFVFDVNYRGIASRDTVLSRSYNSLNLSAEVKSNNNDSNYLYYEAGLKYNFGQQDLGSLAAPAPVSYVREHMFSVAGTVGPVFSYVHSVLVGIGFKLAGYGVPTGYDLRHAGLVSLAPRYVYVKDRWNVTAGLSVEFLLKPNGSVMNTRKGQVVYPKVDVNFEAVQDCLNIFFKADGGADVNDYASMIVRNHWFDPLSAASTVLLDNTVTRADLALGINGNITSRFAYDLRVGYAAIAGAALDGARICSLGNLVQGVSYSDINMPYARLSFDLRTSRVDLDGEIRWACPSFMKSVPEQERMGLLPSPLRGNVSFTWNWIRRIYAGVSIDAALGRKGAMSVAGVREAVRMPGYIDLGLDFSYRVTRSFSLWAKGGNLACMTIQRTPLHAEAGPYFTLGVCLNL